MTVNASQETYLGMGKQLADMTRDELYGALLTTDKLYKDALENDRKNRELMQLLFRYKRKHKRL